MKTKVKNLIYAIFVSSILGCTKTNEVNQLNNNFTFHYSFINSNDGWITGYSDYPANFSLDDSLNLYKMFHGYSILPNNICPIRKGIKIQGVNRSDDLFMFLKRKITCLNPNTQYKISFELEIASNAPTNNIGVGGAPGESVYLKVGAKNIEPNNIKDNLNYYRINIDKGNQASCGNDMIIIGNIGVSDSTNNFTLIKRKTINGFLTTTNSNGEIWVIIGTDSGYEGLTELYYSDIKLHFENQ